MTSAPTFCLTNSAQDAEVVAIPVAKGPVQYGGLVGSSVDQSMIEASGFEGGIGETLVLHGAAQTTVLVGVGTADSVDASVLRRAAAAALRASWKRSSLSLHLLEALPKNADVPEALKAVIEGAGLGAYRYTVHKSDPKPCKISEVSIVVGSDESDELQAVLVRSQSVVAAVYLARDLVNEPPGSMTPERFTQRALEVGEQTGLAAEVIDEGRAMELGLGGLLGVSQGSIHPPRLVKLIFEPTADGVATPALDSVALVGKGITFDSGGLSLKTGEGMMTMKSDMSGAAAVLATMSLLSVTQPSVKVTGYMVLAENMPSGDAIKPGDVLRTRSGKTIEVLNTDAEGRLVLADALALAVEDGASAIVDLATLTGACVVALGNRIAGLMGTSDDLRDQLQAASLKTDESIWPLPLPPEYRKQIDSDIADLKNIGNGRYAGTLTAGLFLKEFTGNVPWAHLDIAGPAFVDADDAWVAKGATGFGVRLLTEFLDGYESIRAETASSADGDS